MEKETTATPSTSVEIELLVEEKSKKDGTRFNVYHSYGKDNKKYEIKFKKSVAPLPTEHCVIIVDRKDINKDKAYRFPRFWIAKIQAVKPFVAKTIDDSDLPF